MLLIFTELLIFGNELWVISNGDVEKRTTVFKSFKIFINIIFSFIIAINFIAAFTWVNLVINLPFYVFDRNCYDFSRMIGYYLLVNILKQLVHYYRKSWRKFALFFIHFSKMYCCHKQIRLNVTVPTCWTLDENKIAHQKSGLVECDRLILIWLFYLNEETKKIPKFP